jgi:tryptophan-rich sensory protein
MQLFVSIAVVVAAAALGSIFTARSVRGWYTGLKKPPFTPPGPVFGPVWTFLYLCMAVSVYLVWQEGLQTAGVLTAFILFWVQLAFNVSWSAVFFGMKSSRGGLAVIAILWLLILATILASFRVAVWAGVLLIPYIFWVSLAAYLNTGIWYLNRKNIPGGG